MALKATVFKADLQIANLDTHQFGDYALTLAQHPSETLERVMVRLLAFALYASEDLRFGRGLSHEEDAAVWEIDPAGIIRLWIDVGLPDEIRIKKACTRADRAVILTYGGRPSDLWLQQQRSVFARYPNLSVIQLSPEDSETLTQSVTRTMKLSWTIQEGMVYLDHAPISPIYVTTAS